MMDPYRSASLLCPRFNSSIDMCIPGTHHSTYIPPKDLLAFLLAFTPLRYSSYASFLDLNQATPVIMHQSALFLALATVALGASAKVNTNTDIHTNPDSTTATVNLLNPPALAARNVDINVLHNVDADSSIVRHPITVELGRRSDVNADLLKDDRPVEVNVAKRLNLNVGATSQEHKLINVDLNRRHIDANADLLKEDNPVNVNVAKRLNLNVDTTPQEHKLINVDLNRRLDANTNTQTTSTVNLARGRMPTALEVSRRNLNTNLDINTLLAKEHKLINVDLGKRFDLKIDSTVHTQINTNDNGEQKLINVDLGKRLDLDIGTTVHTNTHTNVEHKLINVNLGKRDLQMSTGYVLDTTKVDANGQGTVVASKRDLNVNVKSEYQHLAAHHKNDNDDDWEDNEEDEDDQTLNETESVANNKEAEKKKEASPSSDDKKRDSASSSTTGQKKNAASRANAFTGLSIVGLVIGSALLWA
ncbi:MAG: hypothetical protein JOS17DRAFT_794138 [Linnemannia elongata]|nr:MAG: hypothetical protein JOS17DRAFT_794138 [Linnemannia elongata]